jgi:hypothetical protein
MQPAKAGKQGILAPKWRVLHQKTNYRATRYNCSAAELPQQQRLTMKPARHSENTPLQYSRIQRI